MFRRKKVAPGAGPAETGSGATPAVATPPAEAGPAAAAAEPAASDGLVGGIDLGGTKVAAAIVGPDHSVISYAKQPTPDRGGPEDVVRTMVATITGSRRRGRPRDVGPAGSRRRCAGIG